MIKAEKLQELLQDFVSYISAEDLNATAGFVPGYCGPQYQLSEDEHKTMGFPARINSETASTIFNIGVRQICKQMIGSTSVLSNEMLASACETISEELQASQGKHLFIYFIPSITLDVEESIKIGDAVIRKATVADARLMEGESDATLVRMASGKGPLDKKDFLKRYLGRTLAEVRFSGCHLKDELSFPGDLARKSFKRVGAFLMACKEVLQIPEVYADGDLVASTWASYIFLVGKGGSAPLIPFCYASQFSIYGLDFVINKQLLEQLNTICHLQAFNKLFQSQGELRDKIDRSLDWYLKGCQEEDPTDRLICFFISLESLMAFGGDALNSQTDELAGNIALLIHQNVPKRVEERRFFKKDVYPLRNRIMHHGHKFDDKDALISERLMIYITSGFVGILRNLDAIIREGGPRIFFEKAKMSTPVLKGGQVACCPKKRP